ncbi:MAG: hypothetical protein ACOY3D_01205 [Candidatus Omnitrophota bacterium]
MAKTRLKSLLTAAAVIAAAIIFTYWKMLHKHFIGDEWTMISETMYSSTLGLGYAFRVYTHHFYPVYFILTNLLYAVAGLNPVYYSICGISIHIINSILVYILSGYFTRDNRIRLIAALLFAVNYPAMEIVFSNAVYMNMGVGGLFSLLSMIFFAKSLTQRRHSALNFTVAMAALLLSFLGGEYSFFLYLVFPLWALLSVDGGIKRFLKRMAALAGTAGLYFWLRSLSANKISGFSTMEDHFSEFIYKLWLYPFKVFSQTYIPREIMTGWAQRLNQIFHIHPRIFQSPDYFAGSWLSHPLTIIFTLLVAMLVIYLSRKNKMPQRNALIIWFAYVVFSVYPYAVPSEVYYAFLQSRYYFYPTVGTSLLLALMFLYFLEILQERIKRPGLRRNLFAVMATIVFAPMLLSHYRYINTYLEEQARWGAIRKSVLDTMYNAYPRPEAKSIFYTESNGSYYGYEKIMPFDDGFANILLTYYIGKGNNFGVDFLNLGRFFRNYYSEGYKEINGQGFGYFRDYDKLLTCLKENHLSAENVYAFRFNASSNETTDITEDIRSRIKNSREDIVFYLGRQNPAAAEIISRPNGQRRCFLAEPCQQQRTVETRSPHQRPIVIKVAADSPLGTVIGRENPSVQYAKTADYVEGDWVGLGTSEAKFFPKDLGVGSGDLVISYTIDYPAGKGMRYYVTGINEVVDLSQPNNFKMEFNAQLDNWVHSGLKNKALYFDMTNEMEVQRLALEMAMYHSIHPNYQDAWYTGRLFTHDGWIGVRLDHGQYGNGTDTYHIPRALYGYEVVGVGRVLLLNNYETLDTERVTWKNDGSWTIKLKRPIKKELISPQGLWFEVWLAVTQFDIFPSGRGIRDIGKTRVLEATADGRQKIFIFNLANAFPSALPLYKGPENTYHVAYINGVMTEVVTLINYPNPVFGIVFADPPAKGAVIKLPLMVSYAPVPQDRFQIKFDGYK